MNENNQHFPNNELRHLHDQCHQYMHHHVVATQANGGTFDGIILDVDVDHVIILVGEDVMGREDEIDYRQYGSYGDDDNGYGRPRRRRYRRYRPQRFPLATLAALSLLPYAAGFGYPSYYPYPAYPYPYPPYPYY